MHGPHALVNIFVVSNLLKISIKPSLSAVNLTCSDPGFIPKVAFGFIPLSAASFTIEAALLRSS